MSVTSTCPHCSADLRGEPIPQECIDAGFYPSGATHYERVIGIEVRGVYDGVLYWQCPDCGGTWQRFVSNSWQAQRAQQYMRGDQRGAAS